MEKIPLHLDLKFRINIGFVPLERCYVIYREELLNPKDTLDSASFSDVLERYYNRTQAFKRFQEIVKHLSKNDNFRVTTHLSAISGCYSFFESLPHQSLIWDYRNVQG